MSLFEKYVPFKRELESYIANCRKVFEEIGDSSSASLVDGFIRDFDKQRYNITIIGSLKRGKSTLLNVLMERNNDHISPISANVCTSAIIKYQDRKLAPADDGREKAVVYFDNKSNNATTIPLSQLKNYVTEENNPENRKQVRSVEVFGDFPDWSKAVTIVDSPGQNSVFNHHDILLSDFLPFTDAIIFLVAADIPLDGGDIALLKELSDNDKKKIFFVLTKIDTLDNPDDLDEVKSFVASKIDNIGLPCEKLYAVAAKPVYDALTGGIIGPQLEALKEENGIAELEADLERFIVAESDQTKVLRARIEALLSRTAASCNRFIETSTEILSRRSCDVAALKAEQSELIDANELLRKNAEQSLKKFARNWEREISRFRRQFSSRSGAVEDKIIDGLGKGGLIGAAFQSFKLKKLVQKAVSVECQPLVLSLEEKLGEVVSTLNNELDEELSLYIRRKSGTDLGATIGTGVATAAMAGTVAWGWSSASAAVASAQTAFAAWQGAQATATVAAAESSVQSLGFLKVVGGFFLGSGKGAAAATATAEAANAASSAIVAGIGAVASIGLSIGVTLLAQKILHIGLVNFQQSRVTGITETIMDEVENSLLKSLDSYKESIIKEYRQHIDDLISDNMSRQKEIENLLLEDNTEERQRITARLEDVKKLLGEGISVQKQIPVSL